VRAIAARGLTMSAAMELVELYKCSMAQLLTMYKCRKSPLKNPVAGARKWLARKPRQSKAAPAPPAEPEVEVVNWVGSDLVDFYPPEAAQVGLVATIVPHSFYQEWKVFKARVEITEVYETTLIVDDVAVTKVSVVGKLLGMLQTFHDNGNVAKVFGPGTIVRFYADHVDGLVPIEHA
jgi:hypothetical protein